ncbi:MAG: hypothetical protein AB4426_28205 [Xenococcaceae cyanobacterium]
MFAPIVVLLRNQMGKAKFNRLRGKAIALHAQAITSFCDGVGMGFSPGFGITHIQGFMSRVIKLNFQILNINNFKL